ncbi:MAG TPA: pilus assembly protein TadG-related protein [Candidatus Binatia bacterium]|nr:pilus assembly protein TadG-related protein [Candidatus Binatia bacterium]
MRHKGESGQVLPLIAICLAALMGFGGMAVDVGYWRYHQREQQSAADAAALGGAQQLIFSGCPNQSAAITAAKNDATNNGFTDGSNGVTVTASNPPSSGPFASNNCAVNATINSSKVATFLTKVFGWKTMAESTQATAAVVADGPGCIYMLGIGQNTNFNGANVQASKCSIFLNGSANFNGANVSAGAIGEVSYSGSNNGGTFTGATPAPIAPVADPCPEIAGCAALTSSPPSMSPCVGSYAGNGILTPGCYNSLNVHGQNITMQTGTYVFAGGSNFSGASINGSAGVTIYIPAGASTNFNKVSALTLAPQTTGPYSGVTFYQVSGNSNTVNFNASSTNVSGMLYAPSAQINYNGAYGLYTVIVANYANFNGSTGEDFGAPPTNASLIKTVVLSQ